LPLFLQTNLFFMSDLMNQLNETVNYIKSRVNVTAKVGIVLGSGLGNLSEVIEVEEAISYTDIPHFPTSTVKGHGGKLLFGKLGGTNVICMSGRFHFYEGYSAQQVVFPVRVMKMLGVETLLLSNAAGGVNANYKVGDLMVINDHISFFTTNPLIGKNEEELGTRFPDMSEPYSKALIAKALSIGVEHNIQLHQGVYTAVTGPTFETHAEYRLIKVIGSDVVGMSTVQENIAAVHCGMKVFAVSVVTDLGIREDDNVITHEEVLQAAKEAEPKLTTLFTELAKAVG
jgi:purine-nucleoside phosphorylase